MGPSEEFYVNNHRFNKFYAIISTGIPIKSACHKLNISKQTLWNWRHHKELGPLIKRAEQEGVDEIRAEAEEIIRSEMKKDAKWAAWYLERRVPEYKYKQTQENVNTGDIEVSVHGADGSKIYGATLRAGQTMEPDRGFEYSDHGGEMQSPVGEDDIL